MQLDGIGIESLRRMTYQVPEPELQERIALYLEATDPRWSCQDCIANALDMTLSEVKIALLRLARFRGRTYIDTRREACEACGMETAVVRLGQRGHQRRVA
jgi:hypothetical protein